MNITKNEAINLIAAINVHNSELVKLLDSGSVESGFERASLVRRGNSLEAFKAKLEYYVKTGKES